MFRTRELRLADFHRLCINTAAAQGYRIVLTLIARRADAPKIYRELREKWHSLNDLTGKEMMFVFAGDDIREDLASANIMDNASGEVVTYSSNVAIPEPGEIEWNHSLKTQFWCPYDLQQLASHNPDPPRNYSAFLHAQTDQISELRDTLGLNETDIPCLHVRETAGDGSYIVRISDENSVYDYAKRIVVAYQEAQTSFTDVGRTRRRRLSALGEEIRNLRQTPQYAEAIRKKRAQPRTVDSAIMPGPNDASILKLAEREAEIKRLKEADKIDSVFKHFRDMVLAITSPTEPSDIQEDGRNEVTQDVVVLVHGIRDFALWQAAIRATLKQAGFVAEPTNYGRFSLVRFLAPIPFFRQWAISEVWEQIRIVKQQHPGARLSFIAHSFGTYVVANLIKRNFDLGAHRIIFCGSVVSYRFRFQDYQGRFGDDILNEVGTRDIWPAMAQSVTWGYGSAGTYGFRRPLVRDRWHNGAGHGYFLSPDFCEKFWVPYLKSGIIVDADDNPESPPLWLRVVSVLKIKYLLLGLAAYFLYVAEINPTFVPQALFGDRIGAKDSMEPSIASCFANPGEYASWPVAFSSQPGGAAVRVALLIRTEGDPWLQKQEGVEQLRETTPTCAILAQNRYRAVFELNGQRRFQDFMLTGPRVVVRAKF